MFRLEDGAFTIKYYDGNSITADQRITAEQTFLRGQRMVLQDLETESPYFLNRDKPWSNYR